MVLEVILEVEKRLIGSKKVKSWLLYCCKKPEDLWEYFNGVKDRLWKYSERVEDEFWKLTPKVEKSLMDLIRVNHDCNMLKSSIEIIGSTFMGLNIALKVLPSG